MTQVQNPSFYCWNTNYSEFEGSVLLILLLYLKL